MGVPSDDREKTSNGRTSKACNSNDTDTIPHHDDLSPAPEEQSDLIGPFLQVLAAWVVVFAQLKYQRDLRISQNPQSPGAIPISHLIFGEFPVCSPDTLASTNFGANAKISTQVRADVESFCNTFITSQLCLIILYWANVVNLFWTSAGNGPWKTRYLPWAFVLGPTGTVLSSIMFGVRDPATIILNVFPVCWNICMAGCLFDNAFVVKRGGRRSSGVE